MSSFDSESDAVPCRKRKRVETWKAVQWKAKRDSGKKCTATAGATVAGRHVGPPCSCLRKCYDLMGHDHI